MSIFGKKCLNCQKVNKNDAKYCESCGTALSGAGGLVCGECKTENPLNAKFCKKCGRPMEATAQAETRGNHWARRDGDFAVRIEPRNLPGAFQHGLIVDPGTQAMIVSRGEAQGILPPGLYTVDTVGQKIANWFTTGIPETGVALLVDVSPTELRFSLQNRFTSDPLPISLSVGTQIEVHDAAKFLLNGLRNRERYSIGDLAAYLEPEIVSAVDGYLRTHTLQSLVENSKTREELELAIDDGLRTTLTQLGLKVLQVRTLTMDLEAHEKGKAIRGKYSLMVEEGKAEVDGKQRWLEVQKTLDLQAVAEDSAKVEMEERRVDVHQRMRQALLSDKLNDVKSEEDFRKFMDSVDRDKLLAERDRQELQRTWKENAEDHQRARAHLLAKNDMQQQLEIRSAELKLRTDIEREQMDFELEMARRRAENGYSISSQEWEFELRRKKAFDDAEIEHRSKLRELENQEDADDLALAKRAQEELLWPMKHKRMEEDFAREEHALKMRLDQARGELDIEMVRERMKHDFEMQRIDKLAGQSIEVLIAASPLEQGRILQDLKRSEILKDMSEEQILAMAAEKNPQLASIFEEKYRAIASGKATEREREMYEKLLLESQGHVKNLQELQKDALDRMERISGRGMDDIRDVSMAYARGGGTPVILTGAGGAVRAPLGNMLEGETKTCPSCGRQVSVDARFCMYCNNEFKDVK